MIGPLSCMCRLSYGGPAVCVLSKEALQLAACLAHPVVQEMMSHQTAVGLVMAEMVRHPSLDIPPDRYRPHGLFGDDWFAGQALLDFERALRLQRVEAEGRVRRAIWPLAERRVSGWDIIDSARSANINHALSESDLLDLCREVVGIALRQARRRHVGSYR